MENKAVDIKEVDSKEWGITAVDQNNTDLDNR